MKPRTVHGIEVRVGDLLTTADTTDWRFHGKVSKVREDGLVQFEGETYHWYSTETKRHIYDDEPTYLRREGRGHTPMTPQDEKAAMVPPCIHSHERHRLVSTHQANARISTHACAFCGWIDTEMIIEEVLEKFGAAALAAAPQPDPPVNWLKKSARELFTKLGGDRHDCVDFATIEKALDSAWHFGFIDCARTEVEAEAAAAHQPAKVCTCRHDSGASTECDVDYPKSAAPQPRKDAPGPQDAEAESFRKGYEAGKLDALAVPSVPTATQKPQPWERGQPPCERPANEQKAWEYGYEAGISYERERAARNLAASAKGNKEHK